MSTPDRIDTHHHIVPPFYRDWLQSRNISAGGKEIPEWTVESAMDLMGRSGVATAITSVSTPGTEPADGPEARTMARRLNEFSADVARENPGSFGFFATLPLPDVSGALAETEYSFDALNADGVVLLANCRGIYLGDSQFEPLLEELDRREAVAFVHPSTLPADPVPGIPAYTADFLLDTTRAAVNLAKSGCLDRYPSIKFILSHGGGFLPYAAQRMATMASPKADLDDGMRLLRQFYFDTALTSSDNAFPSLLAFAQPGHVTFGSDWPYAPAGRSLTFTRNLDTYPDSTTMPSIGAPRSISSPASPDG